MRRTQRAAAEEPVGAAEFESAFAGLAGDSEPILAAISGGPDSVALMHALASWSGAVPGRPSIVTATVDHGLRAESASEAAQVAAAAGALGLPHRVLTWAPPAGSRPVSQAAAREARYGLLVDHARLVGAGRLATAHTLDDQAETVLMRLAAGSGPAGLAGMAATTHRQGIVHHRPFLTLAKARLVATCRAEGRRFVDDPSNFDPRYARARWRRLAPALAAEGLGPDRLGRLARRMQRVEAALDRMTMEAAARCRPVETAGGTRLEARALAAEPAEIALRLLARAVCPDGSAGPRLERLETCWEALHRALQDGRRARRTLGGQVLDLDRSGALTIRREGPRSRGAARPVTAIEARVSHSLGIREGHA